MNYNKNYAYLLLLHDMNINNGINTINNIIIIILLTNVCSVVVTIHNKNDIINNNIIVINNKLKKPIIEPQPYVSQHIFFNNPIP